MLKSRTMFPPKGGWRFRESKTGWSAPDGLSFSQVVEAIINHRLQNPRFNLATDKATVENELDDYTCHRLGNDPNWCVDLPVVNFCVPPPQKQPAGEAVKGSAAGVSKFLANTKAGIKLWIDWFGEGKPVDWVTAERRAVICADRQGKPCPMNQPADIQQTFTAVAAKQIMAIFSALHDLNLHTKQDSKLKVCKACDCPMKAKVWAPLDIIKKHLTSEARESLDAKCWILSEDK